MSRKVETPLLKLKDVDYDSIDQDDEKGEDKKGTDLGLPLEKLNLGTRKKLLVIEMGGLLVHRVHRLEPTPHNRNPDYVAGHFLLFKRPHCDDFLNFCFERFHVGFWSSATKWNVDHVLNGVMSGLKDKLLFVWDQKDCTKPGFMSLEKEDKPIFLKELKKIWNNPSSLKGCAQFSSSNTLMIDNEPYKALLNPTNTGIFPSSYRAYNYCDNVLSPEGELRRFLDGLSDAENVPSYVKDNPIGQPEVNDNHSDWDFYSKIVQHFR